MVLSEIIADIRDIASSGSDPIDFRISDENIIFWINQVRATLISQSIQKRTTFTDSWIQTIGCLKMQQTDKSECCEATTNCFLLKSVKPLPNTIETDDNNLVLSVHGIDGTEITKTNQFRYKYKKFNKFTGNRKGWFLRDNFLYIINDDLLSTVSVQGVFENPTELDQFVTCENIPCFNRDTTPYPISSKMASIITDIVVKTKVLPFLQFPRDTANDATNNPDQQLNPKTLSSIGGNK